MAGNLYYLTTNDWVLIRAKTELRTFKLGEEIIREGDLDPKPVHNSPRRSFRGTGRDRRAGIVATLGPKDLCGDMAFLGQSRATATVVAKDVEVEVEEINSQDLRAIPEAFPRLASRVYLSLALILSQRLKATSLELGWEMTLRGPPRVRASAPPRTPSFSMILNDSVDELRSVS